MDRIGGVMVSVHASSVVDCMDRITIGDRFIIGGVMVLHHRW
jgi:hypothetical protein